jgi:hypothetical protein
MTKGGRRSGAGGIEDDARTAEGVRRKRPTLNVEIPDAAPDSGRYNNAIGFSCIVSGIEFFAAPGDRAPYRFFRTFLLFLAHFGLTKGLNSTASQESNRAL